MPHKFNARCRHKFAKKRYRITNWSRYIESLRQRGDVTVWLSPEVEAEWRAGRPACVFRSRDHDISDSQHGL